MVRVHSTRANLEQGTGKFYDKQCDGVACSWVISSWGAYFSLDFESVEMIIAGCPQDVTSRPSRLFETTSGADKDYLFDPSQGTVGLGCSDVVRQKFLEYILPI